MAIRAAEQVQGADLGKGRVACCRHGQRSEPDRLGLSMRSHLPCGGAFLETAASFETVHTQLLYGASSSAIVPGARDSVAFSSSFF